MIHNDAGKVLLINDSWTEITGYRLEDIPTITDWTEKAYGEKKDSVRAHIATLYDAGRKVEEGEFEVRTKSGDTRTWIWGSAPLGTMADGRRVVISMATDVTERKKAEELIRLHDERLLKSQAAGNVGSWEFDLQSGNIWGSAEGFRIFGMPYANEEVPIEEVEACIPEHQRVNQALMELINNAKGYDLEYEVQPADGAPPRIVNSIAELVCDEHGKPLKVIGIVQDITERKRAETALSHSEQKLRALSARLENLREEESKRIAREIHDELGQSLTGVKMDLSWVEQKLEPHQSTLIHRCQEAQDLVDNIITAVQRISSELRPGMLDDVGLSAAIEWYAQEFQRRTGLNCHVKEMEEVADDSDQHSTALFRIFQECLTNVARHAHARNIEVRLTHHDDHIVLQVTDDGCGISEEQIESPTSIGLHGMKERVHAVHGAIVIAGKPGIGTSVTVTMPLTETSPLS